MPRRSLNQSLILSRLKGHRWATGKTDESPEDSVKKAEEAMGREWFAITAFPLFAGTFGTIASALNICALVQPWRCDVIDGLFDVKDISDPSWVIGLNALSLCTGLIANLAMMPVVGDDSPLAKYGIRSLHLILITIIGGFIASFILIGLLVATAVRLRLPSPPQHAFTEAYYYAIMAAVVYFITSAFIVYTAYMIWSSRQTRGELRSQFVNGHRSLKLLTMLFMAYMLSGAAIYSKVEGWKYLDAVFWADTTLLTIGFGTFKPITHLGRCLLFPYATCGIFILFLVIYCITSVVFERGKSMWEVRLRDQQRIRSVNQRTKESNHSGNEKPQDPSGVVKSDEARMTEEREARRRDFNTMQLIMVKAERKRVLYSMGLWVFFASFLWFVGAVVFFLAEKDHGWSYFDAIYFTFISLTAIGYGDAALQSMAGKAFFVLWSLIVVPTLTMLITTGTEAVGLSCLTAAKQWYKKRILKIEDPPKIQRHLSQFLMPTEQLSNNTHDKNLLLAQAIKAVAIDHIKNQQANSRQDYSFEDWEYIFYLMGVLEPSNDEQTAPAGEENPGNPVLKPACSNLEEWTDGGQILDWLHGKNPLNGSDTVTEWVLLSLVDKLEMELLELRKQLGSTSVQWQALPLNERLA